MHCKLLVTAALTAALAFPAAPVFAQRSADKGMARPGFGGDPRFSHRISPCQTGDRRHLHRNSDFGFGFGCGFGWAYADGEWALYNNRSWEPDSYNDWWHDRPDRAFPRWAQDQGKRGTCDQDRMWWSGSGWHC